MNTSVSTFRRSRCLHVLLCAFAAVVGAALLYAACAAADANCPRAYAASSYKIVYKLNGGTQPVGQVRKVTKGKKLKIGKIKAPTRSNYTFKGWYKDARFKKKATVLVGKKAAAGRTVYAKWQLKTYKLTYVLDGGTLPKKAITSYAYSTSETPLPVPTRSGYSFMGWYTKSTLSGYPLFSIPEKKHKKYTLYAKWRKRVYVNHRGANTSAPENTLVAFYLSKAAGFEYVETDVRFTADGVPVLLHDATVNRTARVVTAAESEPDPEPDPESDAGSDPSADTQATLASGEQVATPLAESTPISSLTFEEVRELDFGVWKDPVYAGTKIPSFEEFLGACKRLSLKPYIELKTGTQEQVEQLVSMVKDAGMLGSSTWISFSFNRLQYVHEAAPSAALSYLVNTITAPAVLAVSELRQDGVDATLDTKASGVTAARLALCKQVGLPVGVWTLSAATKASTYDQYIYAFTANS